MSLGAPSPSRLAGVAVALVGGAVLAGWLFAIEPLTSVLPHLSTMKPTTALAFLLAGAALALLAPRTPDRRARRLARGCAVIVVLVGGLTLGEYAAGRDLGIDQLLFADLPSGVDTAFPGRMGINTAVSFLLLGLALLGLDVATPGGRRPADLLALAGGTVALVALVGYLYSVTALYGIASYTQMALHTAGALCLLAGGILMARPDRGLMATVTSDRLGGSMARRLLPAVLGVPLAVGWLRLEASARGSTGRSWGWR